MPSLAGRFVVDFNPGSGILYRILNSANMVLVNAGTRISVPKITTSGKISVGRLDTTWNSVRYV